MKDLYSMDLNFCVKRLPKKLRKLMIEKGDTVIVAGGYIRSVLIGDKVNDIDVFAGDKNRSRNLAIQLEPDIKPYVTENAVTVRCLPIAIQFIHRWKYHKPEEILASFDFTICQTAIWYNRLTKKWIGICGDRFYMDLACKRLHYLSPIRDEAPGGSMLRILKYYQRGYRIPLDSLGAVISRVCGGFDFHKSDFKSEQTRTKVITGLLFEVDPNTVIQHEAYFPIESQIDDIELFKED